MRKKYKRIKKPITPEEKLWMKLMAQGINRSKAYRMAFPQDHRVVKYIDAVKTKAPSQEKRRLSQLVSQASKDKLQTQHMQGAMITYNNKMEEFSNKAIDTAIDLVENARSEKVRADLAIEGMRHRVGSPVQKMQVQQDQNIVITFGERHPDDVLEVEAEEV